MKTTCDCQGDERCRTCIFNKPCICGSGKDVDEHYSFGAYAGKFCDDCARNNWADQCGLGPAGQGDPNAVDDGGPVYPDLMD